MRRLALVALASALMALGACAQDPAVECNGDPDCIAQIESARIEAQSINGAIMMHEGMSMLRASGW
jgi:hypothetical protein